MGQSVFFVITARCQCDLTGPRLFQNLFPVSFWKQSKKRWRGLRNEKCIFVFPRWITRNVSNLFLFPSRAPPIFSVETTINKSTMATSRYRNFLKLIKEWPLDETKVGRDLGLIIRQRVSQGFKEGENSTVDEAVCDKTYENLSRINADYYRRMYPRLKDTSASGLSVEECRVMTSTDTMLYFQGGSQSLWDRLKNRNKK